MPENGTYPSRVPRARPGPGSDLALSPDRYAEEREGPKRDEQRRDNPQKDVLRACLCPDPAFAHPREDVARLPRTSFRLALEAVAGHEGVEEADQQERQTPKPILHYRSRSSRCPRSAGIRFPDSGRGVPTLGRYARVPLLGPVTAPTLSDARPPRRPRNARTARTCTVPAQASAPLNRVAAKAPRFCQVPGS